jgi:hypothetical protein
MTYHRATDCDVPKLEINETWECDCGRTWTRTKSHDQHSYYEIVTETSQRDEYGTDVVEVTPTERNRLWLRSELIHRTIEGDELEADIGVQIHQDGRHIALAAGTLDEISNDDVTLEVYTGLEPTQARELADALYVAADNAEREYDGEMPEHDEGKSSLLEKLLGGKQ